MKIDNLARTGLVAVGLAAVAGGLLGLAAGMALARNPDGLRRAAGRAARVVADGVEQASLVAAQAREQIGDLWAEAREAARGAVDDADFSRQATAAAASAAATAASAEASADAEPVAAAEPKPRRRARAPRRKAAAAD